MICYFITTLLTTLSLLSLNLWSRIYIKHQTSCVLRFIESQFWKRAWRSFSPTSQYKPSQEQLSLGELPTLMTSHVSFWPHLVPLSTAYFRLSELFCQLTECIKLFPKSGTWQILLLCLNCSLPTVHQTDTQIAFISQGKHYFLRQVLLTAPTIILFHLKKLLAVTITSHISLILILF